MPLLAPYWSLCLCLSLCFCLSASVCLSLSLSLSTAVRGGGVLLIATPCAVPLL
eukprot:COSAG05_NODE_93_length_19581_cov_53.686685_17_plen_54_part_00